MLVTDILMVNLFLNLFTFDIFEISELTCYLIKILRIFASEICYAYYITFVIQFITYFLIVTHFSFYKFSKLKMFVVVII